MFTYMYVFDMVSAYTINMIYVCAYFEPYSLYDNIYNIVTYIIHNLNKSGFNAKRTYIYIYKYIYKFT